MKKLLIVFLLLLMGCAAPLELKTGDDLYSEGSPIEALTYYEIALKKAQTESQRGEILNAIERTKIKIVDNLLHEASLAHDESTPPAVPSIEKAISILNQGLQYDDKLKRLAGKIQEYNIEKKNISSNVTKTIENAHHLASKGELLEALAVLENAQSTHPSCAQLEDKVADLTQFIEKQKRKYLVHINELLTNAEVKKADDILKKLALIAPDYPRLEALQAEIANARKEHFLQKIPRLTSQNKYYTAFRLLAASGYEGLDDRIADIISLGGKYYYDKAKAYSDSGNIFLAYVAAVKAKELLPNDVSIFQFLIRLEDTIEKEIQKYIAILTFGAPANDPDAGKLFSGALMSSLFKKLPYGINIVEGENIDLLEKEKALDLQNLGNRLGVDLMITGNVSLFKVEKRVVESMASQKIKIGEETKPNPEFNQMLQTYGKNVTKWPHQPPMTYTEEKFEIVQYKKGSVDAKAFGNVSIRIFDSKKAAIVFAKDLNGTIETSDNFQESIAAANIPEDPLHMPSETELKGQLRDDIVQTTLDTILDIFKNREERFLQSTLIRIKRKEYGEALKFLAEGYLYCKKSQTTNQTSDKIYDLMIDLSEEY